MCSFTTAWLFPDNNLRWRVRLRAFQTAWRVNKTIGVQRFFFFLFSSNSISVQVNSQPPDLHHLQVHWCTSCSTALRSDETRLYHDCRTRDWSQFHHCVKSPHPALCLMGDGGTAMTTMSQWTCSVRESTLKRCFKRDETFETRLGADQWTRPPCLTLCLRVEVKVLEARTVLCPDAILHHCQHWWTIWSISGELGQEFRPWIWLQSRLNPLCSHIS